MSASSWLNRRKTFIFTIASSAITPLTDISFHLLVLRNMVFFETILVISWEFYCRDSVLEYLTNKGLLLGRIYRVCLLRRHFIM